MAYRITAASQSGPFYYRLCLLGAAIPVLDTGRPMNGTPSSRIRIC